MIWSSPRLDKGWYLQAPGVGKFMIARTFEGGEGRKDGGAERRGWRAGALNWIKRPCRVRNTRATFDSFPFPTVRERDDGEGMQKLPNIYRVVMSGTKEPRGGKERPRNKATGARQRVGHPFFDGCAKVESFGCEEEGEEEEKKATTHQPIHHHAKPV